MILGVWCSSMFTKRKSTRSRVGAGSAASSAAASSGAIAPKSRAARARGGQRLPSKRDKSPEGRQCKKRCDLCFTPATIENWPHANFDGNLCSVDANVKRRKFEDIGQSTFVEEGHRISADSYNLWKWRAEYESQRGSGGKVEYSPWVDDVPPGWHPPVGEWQPELRVVNPHVYDILPLKQGAATPHPKMPDGSSIVPSLDIADQTMCAKFPVHQPCTCIRLEPGPAGDAAEAEASEGPGFVINLALPTKHLLWLCCQIPTSLPCRFVPLTSPPTPGPPHTPWHHPHVAFGFSSYLDQVTGKMTRAKMGAMILLTMPPLDVAFSVPCALARKRWSRRRKSFVLSKALIRRLAV